MQEVIKDGIKVRQMSVQEYADSVGLDYSSVTKQIRLGKLPPGVEAIPFGRFYLIETKITKHAPATQNR